MSFVLPTTKQQFDSFLARLEGNLGQQSPINDLAFLRIIAGIEAGIFTTYGKWAADAVKGCLAITANKEQLIVIGTNYGIPIKPSEPAQFTITLPAITGTIISTSIDFVGDANGIRYSVDAISTSIAGVATINITSKSPGSDSNLTIGDTLSIGTPVPGAQSQATITIITNIGSDQEETDTYRKRILDKIRSPGNGSNASSYRNWAQEVGGVKRAYPFSGKPITSALSSAPPDRTIYIEAETSIDQDGIAPTALLNEVRSAIIADPLTGITRQPLGLTNNTLYVEPITRTAFHITVIGLLIDNNVESQAKNKFYNAAEKFLRLRYPYVDGVDSPIDNRSTITDPSIGKIAQDVFGSYGGSIDGIIFDVTPGTSISRYQLLPNETAKLGGIAYA